MVVRLRGFSILLAALLFLLIFLIFLRYPFDRNSLKVYFHAGPNVFELLRTFDHFRKDPDSRKYEAVKFLVRNMDQHYYIEDAYGDKKIEWYFEHFDRVQTRLEETEDSLETAWTDLRAGITSKKIRDARGISAEFLITHINQAFENWDSSQWNGHFSFDHFCEFMLPYKPWECKPELWLEYYKEKYSGIMASQPDSISLLERLYILKDTAEAWSHNTYFNLGRKMTPVEMQRVRSGDCYYDATWIKLICLSLGMPVSTIYLPNEANASGMHFWNAYLDEKGKWCEFMDRQRISIVTWSIVAPKVFLQNWGKQDKSFRSIAKEYGMKTEDIPPCLVPWTAVDITESIIPCSDVEVEIKIPDQYDNTFVYLAVFDDRVWDPVHWAFLENEKAVFTGMGHNALYLPVYYRNGVSSQAGELFILDFKGDIIHPTPDTTTDEHRLLDRVYPLRRNLMNNHSKDLIGATITGSNDSLFEVYDTLMHIKMEPNLPRLNDPVSKYTHTYDQWWGEDTVDIRKSYRYLKYYWAKDRSSNIGDLELYDIHNDKILPAILKAPGENPDALFDGIFGEDYQFPEKGSWIWMDMGRPVNLYRVRYIAYDIDPASVQTGDDYLLSIWDGMDWKEVLKMKAANKSIPCHLHPGGIYLLENLSRFVHSRPFRYLPERDVIEWW